MTKLFNYPTIYQLANISSKKNHSLKIAGNVDYMIPLRFHMAVPKIKLILRLYVAS